MADQRLELLKLQADVARQNAALAQQAPATPSLAGQLALTGGQGITPMTGGEAIAKGLLTGFGASEMQKAEKSREAKIQEYMQQQQAYAEQLNSYTQQVQRQYELTQAVAPYARTVTQIMADAKAGLISPDDANQRLNSLYTDALRSKGVSGRVSLLQDMSGFVVEGQDSMSGQPINSTVSYGDLLSALPEELRQPLADQAYATIRGQSKLAETEAMAGRPLSAQERAIAAGVAEAPKTQINVEATQQPIVTAFDAVRGIQPAPLTKAEQEINAEGMKRINAELDTTESTARSLTGVTDLARRVINSTDQELTGFGSGIRAELSRAATASGMSQDFIDRVGGLKDKDLAKRATLESLFGELWLNTTTRLKGALTEQEGARIASMLANPSRTKQENLEILGMLEMGAQRQVEQANFVRAYSQMYGAGAGSYNRVPEARKAFDLYIDDLGRAQLAGEPTPDLNQYLQQDFLARRLSTAEQMRQQRTLTAPNLSGAQPSGGGNPVPSQGQVPAAPSLNNSAPPSGIDPADWQYMTPAERALFGAK
ncbi:MAG: hypothetical protein ACK5NY_03495 [Burkholderiaceae bacterium]